jgi:hypothetical protein
VEGFALDAACDFPQRIVNLAADSLYCRFAARGPQRFQARFRREAGRRDQLTIGVDRRPSLLDELPGLRIGRSAMGIEHEMVLLACLD